MAKGLPFTFSLIAGMVIGCLSDPTAVTNRNAGDEVDSPVVSHRTLTAHGGRVDWCASDNHILKRAVQSND